MQVIIDFGETRHIMLEVVSIKNDEFVISSASYVLRNEQTGKDETAGSCNIIEHLIDTVIEPKEKGEYQLIVTYKIADETLIDAVKVVVSVMLRIFPTSVLMELPVRRHLPVARPVEEEQGGISRD